VVDYAIFHDYFLGRGFAGFTGFFKKVPGMLSVRLSTLFIPKNKELML